MPSPVLNDQMLSEMLPQVQDYQLMHGSVVKLPVQKGSRYRQQNTSGSNEEETLKAMAMGITLLPTPFPRKQFDEVSSLQPIFQELYARVSENEEWLREALGHTLEVSDLTRKLWNIYERAQEVGEVQPLRCGIWRSDYMLHRPGMAMPGAPGEENKPKELHPGRGHTLWGRTRGFPADTDIKQVEFRTFAAMGSSHSQRVAEMHHFIADKGAHLPFPIQQRYIPANENVRKLVKALQVAHNAYESPGTSFRPTAILMTVQAHHHGFDASTSDERPIEYGLWKWCDPGIPMFRVEFGEQILDHCFVGENRELLYHPPNTTDVFEISVVYHRAGFDESEYASNVGIEARLVLEESRAIKCPTVLGQIAGFKRVQEELTKPGELERFLDKEKAQALRRTFVEMMPFDESDAGNEAAEMCENPRRANDIQNYVLKPSLEGGGSHMQFDSQSVTAVSGQQPHNVYGRDIPKYLRTIPKLLWDNYILQEKIKSPLVHGNLALSDMVYQGPIVSELGVLGSCVWKRTLSGKCEMVSNLQTGWTFRTKATDPKDPGAVKSQACFDCPMLVD